jgi:DNA-binding HxlR family transcriptional regulator
MGSLTHPIGISSHTKKRGPSAQLLEKALAKCGLVERTAHASLVSKVEYSLTPLGSKLIPLIARIAKLQNLKDPSPS